MVATLTLPSDPPDPDATRTGSAYGVSPEDGILPWLADYEVLEEIGRGGGGIVFRARQWAADRIVALKFMLRGVGSPIERQRFRAEVHALGRLNHPNVVVVHDVGEADGCPYFAMEYLPGGSLGKWARERPYQPADAAVLVETLAHAVQAGHDAGVLHRDLKPGNVLLTADGIPKVADFGLAKRWDDGPDADTVDRMTRTREVIGTPAYMAPEQAAANHGSVSPATDVYGLGTILYELLTGRPPFKGDESQNTRWLVLNTRVVPPRDRNRRIPRALEAIALKCLEKDPADRYQTAQKLADDLGRARRGEPTVARPITWVGRAGRMVRRHSRAFGLATAGAVVVLAVVAIGTIIRNGRNNAADNPEKIVARMEQDLREDNAVTLIGATGRPKWHRWSAGEASFTTSVFSDESCCIQSAAAARMELIREVPSTGFRLTAEMRHESTLDMGDQSHIGIFFGAWTIPWPTGGDVEHWYSITYNDFDSLERPMGFPQNVHLDDYSRLIRPGIMVDPAQGLLGIRAFIAAVPASEPIWRRVVVEVREFGITAYWEGPKGQLLLIGHKPQAADVLNSVGNLGFKSVADNVREAALPPWPGWSPRGSVGLFVGRGQASFRNFVIEP